MKKINQVVDMTNAERVAKALKKNEVELIFGQSNPSKIILAAINMGIRQIGYRQENAGTYMAQAYAMATGKIPVVAAQNGPAATLLVPGLAECYKAGHPIVAIVQEVALKDAERNAFQEIDHEQLFLGCSKWVKKIYSEERIEDYIDMAFTAAGEGKPGPAVLLFPVDIFNDKTVRKTAIYRSKSLGNYPIDRKIGDPNHIKEAARLLMEAEKPFIYAGGGVFSSQASEELRMMQEKFALPVATTTMGKGAVDEEASLSMGPIGYYMGYRGVTKFMKPMVQNADVILLIGNRTNQNGTDSWSLLPKDAQYIHLDIDSVEIGRNYEALRLAGDAQLTIRALIAEMEKLDSSKRIEARKEIEREIAEAKEKHLTEAREALESDRSPLRMERVMAELEKTLNDDHILVCDASFSSIWIANYIKATKKREFYFPRGLAGLGWGFPMSMGVKLAKPGQKVFCLTGDGGFAHVWSELETCKREGINVVVAVINNEILGYQKFAELYKFGAYTNACDFVAVNHAAIAEACGVKGIVVSEARELKKAFEEAMEYDGSVVIDLVTDEKCQPPLPFIEELKIAELV